MGSGLGRGGWGVCGRRSPGGDAVGDITDGFVFVENAQHNVVFGVGLQYVLADLGD